MKKNSQIFIGATILAVSVGAIFFVLYKAFVVPPAELSIEIQNPSIHEPVASSSQTTSSPNLVPAKQNVQDFNYPEYYPKRIIIPKINVSANIAYVGLGKTGNIAVPPSYYEAGWWKGGAVPGRKGTAILDGHFDNGLGFPAVFYELNNLTEGDLVRIITRSGEGLNFVVTDKKVVEAGERAVLSELFRLQYPMIALITCDGVWIKEEKAYDKRLIVVASLAN